MKVGRRTSDLPLVGYLRVNSWHIEREIEPAPLLGRGLLCGSLGQGRSWVGLYYISVVRAIPFRLEFEGVERLNGTMGRVMAWLKLG